MVASQILDSSDKPLQGRNYAITGGVSGIGPGIAKLLSQRGAEVCIADVDTQAIEVANEYSIARRSPFSITKVGVSKC
ncbi:short-chain dehydrogenase [Fusarium pseudocircinatum]|uniref:Short-chain dehydrogenase n=1 Tax=Fusarium pseudocircinatum TaxID=56676 RepID=A0A8H5PUW3_9HYPO|nr:short-chain dehydrogenase [Fusarium pseudocircinatum]